jgi:hypothetical protein
MSKCITEYIDDYCKDTYGHANWEFYDSNIDRKDKYHKIYEHLNIGILKTSWIKQIKQEDAELEGKELMEEFGRNE